MIKKMLDCAYIERLTLCVSLTFGYTRVLRTTPMGIHHKMPHISKEQGHTMDGYVDGLLLFYKRGRETLMKVDLNNWSEAEMDLTAAKAIASQLSEALFHEGHLQQESDVAYTIVRLIESALGWIADGSLKESTDVYSEEDVS